MDPEHLALLRIHDACKGLSHDDIDVIAANVEVVHGQTGETIHHAGQEIDALYLVVQGRLKMAQKMPNGEVRTIRYISTGDQFGALLLVTEKASPADVEVDESAVLLRLERAKIDQIVDRFPIFRRNLLRKLGFAVQDSMLRRSKRTVPKTVTFIHADDLTRRVVSDIANRLVRIGEHLGIFCDSFLPPYDSDIPFKSLRNENGDYVDESDLRSTLAGWPQLDRVFIVVDRLHPAEKLARLVELSDSMFCLSTIADLDPTITDLKALFQKAPSWKKKTHFLWVLHEQEQVVPLVPILPQLVERDFKVQLRGSHAVTRLFTQGIDRIVHYLRGVSIGIALSGGAAHGMTHLGVLRALDEAGITIDKMSGTSAGVLTGVVYCAGFSPEWGIKQFTQDLTPDPIYKNVPQGDGIYLLKKYRTKSFDPMLRKYLHDWRLEQLPIPISTVTTDLVSARSVVRSSGDAVDSIVESINLPVISTPICRDGMLLVDGGILNNLPADVLVKQGCNFVIAVDVSATIEHRMGENTASTPTEKMKAPGVVSTLLRCLSVQAHQTSAVGSQPADVIIAPDISMFDSTAFVKTPEMSEIGYQTTMEALPRIRKVLKNIDPDLFRE